MLNILTRVANTLKQIDGKHPDFTDGVTRALFLVERAYKEQPLYNWQEQNRRLQQELEKVGTSLVHARHRVEQLELEKGIWLNKNEPASKTISYKTELLNIKAKLTKLLKAKDRYIKVMDLHRREAGFWRAKLKEVIGQDNVELLEVEINERVRDIKLEVEASSDEEYINV